MDNFEKLLGKSFRFLSYRPRSEKEVKDYLKKKSFFAKAMEGQEKNNLESVIDSIINKLKEQKFLNDEEFVKWWIEQRTTIKPKASRLIKIELKQKGIAKDLIDKIFEESSSSDLEKATVLAKRRIKRYSHISDRKKLYDKLGRFLASRGFNYETIKEVIDQILPKEYNK